MADLNDLVGAAGSLRTPGLGDAVGGSSNKELMRDARMSLSGNWGLAVLGNFLYVVLLNSVMLFAMVSCVFVAAVSAVAGGGDAAAASSAIYFAAYLFLFLIGGAAMVGFCGFFLGIAQEGAARLEQLFLGFRHFGKSAGVYFLFMLFYYLWSLLFIIPGIIAAFRYSMAFFIIADDEDCGPLEAIGRSKEMMKGNKWKFFCLHWRFVGWYLLASVTGGIGYLWLIPYMQTAFAKFYEDVK